MTTDWDCDDCGESTKLEYYSVQDDCWEAYGNGDGLLCIGCLEERMGKELTPADFTDYPINSPLLWSKSTRLLNRLGVKNGED